MLFDPCLLPSQRFRLIRARLQLNFAQVVPKLVISYDEGIGLPGILDAVRVIVVLRGCLDHDAPLRHLVQCGD